MKKVHFAQSQYRRKREFVVLTQLIEENNSKFITKESIYPEGEKHIQTIFDNYNLLNKPEYLFVLPQTKFEKSKLYIDYIDHPNLASEIETLLIEGNYEKATSKIQDFFNFLKKIPTIKSNPYQSTDFVRLFDPKKQYFSKTKIDCWSPGFYDTNLDNFIKKDNTYYFVDFEWCFNFPIPRDYLLLRSLFYLGIKLNRILQTIVSDTFPCFNFYHNILVPVAWLNFLDHSTDRLQLMLDYEYNLLQGIYIYYPPLDTIKKDYLTTPITNPVERFQGASKLRNILKETQLQNNNLQQILKDTNQHVANLEALITLKDNHTKNLTTHIEKLIEINDSYQKTPYKVLKHLEGTRLAKSKSFKFIFRRILSFFIYINHLFRKE